MDWYWILLTLVAAYIVVSTLFLCFPCCKRKNPIIIEPRQGARVLLGAHRGGSIERLENSRAAFNHAVECGAQILEMDVQLTRDQQVVVHHDYNLRRICGIERRVSELDFDDIPPAQERVPSHFGRDHYTLQPGIDDGRIPLLEDVFKDHPRVPMNIDLKGGNDILIGKVKELILKYSREEVTYWGDMNEKINMKAKREGEPHGIRTFCSIKFTFWICVAYFLGLLPFIPIRHYSVWFPFFSNETMDKLKEAFGNGCRVKTLTCVYSCLTFLMRPMFWHLRRRGIFVMFWVLNSENEYNSALKYSIDGVLTDSPERLSKIMYGRYHSTVPTDDDLREGYKKFE